MGLTKGHLGQPSGFKAGFGQGGGFSPPSGFMWANQQAKAFYDAEVVENPTFDSDCETKYGVDIDVIKGAIDDWFVAYDTAGILSKHKRVTPRIGTTLNEYRINAIDPSLYTGVFASGSSVGLKGVAFNGSSGTENTGFKQNDFTAYMNLGASFRMSANSLGQDKGIIGGESGGTYTLIYTTAATYFYNYMGAPSFVDFHLYSNGYWSYSKIGTTIKTYLNGALIETGTQAGDLSLGTATMMIASYAGGQYANMTTSMESFHDGLTDTETLAKYNADLAFDTTLNRV